MSGFPAPSVDLTDCDREPIHLLGHIQPFGVLLVLSPDWTIAQVSANASTLLGESADALIGRPADSIFNAAAIHTLRGRLQFLVLGQTIERIFRIVPRDGLPPCDIAVHLSGDHIVVELEPSDLQDPMDATTALRAMVNHLRKSESIADFCSDAARQMRGLTGFDRVMVYRFGHDEAGEVIAESARPGIGSFLNHRFPASDIPKQARELYRRNWLRVISDVDAEAVPIVPSVAASGEPLDLSLSVLRSVSPIHLEYLRNMGLRASLSVSILRHGKLWGLFACHHTRPIRVSFERRTAAELFGQMFSLLLESREREEEIAYESRSRQIHTCMMSTMAAERAGAARLAERLDELRELIRCDGVAIWKDGIAYPLQGTPTHEEIAGLARFLIGRPEHGTFATHELGRHHPPATDFVERSAGVLSIPISRTPSDYLMFFRKEASRTVTWAGNPYKPASLGPNGIRLTPRKSFEAWQETVRGRSHPWTDVDLRIAESVRVSLLEIILRMADQADIERKVARERQELLIAELNHRVRNILSLIRGLVTQSRASARSVAAFAAVLGHRIEALARAHEQITRDSWRPAPLRNLIKAEAEAYLTDKADHVVLDGPAILLAPEAFATLALVIHELTTNSAKYGAMCDNSGRVKVSWSFDPVNGLAIVWTEEGGPPVVSPTRRGFGSTIIERSVPYDLHGTAEITYAVTGLTARFGIPASYCALASEDADAVVGKPKRGKADAASIQPLTGNVLLVEDNMMIALDSEDMLVSLGAHAVHVVGDVAAALMIIEDESPTFALLDLNLGNETSVPVAAALRERGIPFVFATGYGEQVELPAYLGGVTIITKPYTADSLRSRLREPVAALKS